MATILPASHADKIQWLNNIPVWVDQWSLSKEKNRSHIFDSVGATRGRASKRISVTMEYSKICYPEKNLVHGDCYKI